MTNPYARAAYPQPLERLGPIVPGRPPLDHVHVWTVGANPGDPRICRECGWTIAEILGTAKRTET